MDPSLTFTVNRAKPPDAEAIAEFVAQATRGRVTVVPQSVLERFGAKGLWLVRDPSNALVGLAGWRAENLIARIDDFLVFPFEFYDSAGRALLEVIENAAQELKCEVSVIFVPLRALPAVVSFYERSGYNRPEPSALPKLWQETVQEATERGRYIMLKRLREELITRPM
jgi:N-acetylglutamate synthase-like GNAT family acetyltransferase